MISSLLIARTTNAATSFEALADDRPTLGLDGAEAIDELDVSGAKSVWALFAPGGACSEGQLRYSDSEGASFTRLTCPAKSFDVDEVLDVAFTSDTDGVMLGLRNRQPVMATTSDGGDTWTERS